MSRRVGEVLGAVVGLVLFSAALLILYHALRGHHYHDVAEQVRSIPKDRILLALLFTGLSYATLTLYDRLALHHIAHSIAYPKVAFTAFTTYTISHNMGFSLFTGGSIRYRLYSAWGLSAPEIAQLMGFGILTFWLGYLTTSAGVFLFSPLDLPAKLGLPFESTLTLGVFVAGILLAYLVLNVSFRRPFLIRGHVITLPTPGTTILQILVGVFDWMIAAAALWILLPTIPGISYPHILGIYLIAQIAGLTSNIPGGLGVFESVFVLLLSSSTSSASVLGSLFVYRIVYYLFPLGVAAVLLGGYELSLRRRVVARAASLVNQWTRAIAPHFFSATAFLAGVILLFSGATPSIHGRMAWLDRFLPLPVIELSHFLGSLVGVALLLLARGLQRRFDFAWIATSVLLVFGIVFSLVKGFDYEEALILGVMLAILIPSRSVFYRKSSIMQEALSPGWMVAIITATLSVVWLTAFSNKHVNFSTDLWWQFSLSGDAPRSWRAASGVIALLAAFSVARLLRSHRPNPTVPSKSELDDITSLVVRSPHTLANLVFLGDKMVLTNPDKDAFVMYGTEGRSWVAMGDPIGPKDSAQELVWQFHELADQHGGWTVFYQVRPDMLPIYLEIGLSLLKLGEEARVDLTEFSLEGSVNKPLRHWHRRPESEGCTFRIVPADQVELMLPELQAISDDWLNLKNTREKRFSLGSFSAPYLLRNPVALVEREGCKIGFANLWLGAEHGELSFDLMRHAPDAPSGVMDFLIIELMLWGKQQGYQWFNLGMAPLSGLEDRAAAPIWNQLASLIYRHGEHFYNFQGLRQYKEKFRPVWEPRYLASPGGWAQYRILTDVSSLVSGGIKGVVTK
jgi:phosphatidylglycerol lysyltransferase